MVKFNHPKSLKISDILLYISEVFKTEKERNERKNYTYFDTFDWRLYKNNLCLIKNANSYTLSKLSTDMPLNSLAYSSGKNPSFWWDFPESMIKSELKKIIGVRSLIPLTSVSCNNQIFKLLNKDEKIVARITFQHIKKRGTSAKEAKLIYLNPVRGYRDELKQIKSAISGIGLKQNHNDLLSISLFDSGIKPGLYSSKLNIKLKPDMTAQQASVLIFSNLLNTIKQNENGIKKDIDTEFLHDFRVAVRRTRAALSQLKEVFSEEITKKAKRDFAALGKMTNNLRDYDVYLLTKENYLQMLPSDLQPGIEPVFKKLEIERGKEQKKLSGYLDSQAYKKIITSWNNILSNRDLESMKAGNSDMPVIKMAKQFIIKRFKKIIKAGSLIDDDTPDPEIHSLRIECKKLRYLLEFFSSLFPKKEMTIIINQLKKLQDNLGDFNDLYVQQQSLKSFLSDTNNNLNNKSPVKSAVGGLISVLYQKQHQVRSEFTQRFEEFSKAENTKLFKKLFS